MAMKSSSSTATPLFIGATPLVAPSLKPPSPVCRATSLRRNAATINVVPTEERRQCPPRRRAAPRMLEQNTVLALLTGAAGIGGGIALVAWTENQGKRTEEHTNTQVCVVCDGNKVITCTVCNGTGKDPLNDTEQCSYCDGVGTITCYNCGGSGIQPRFLDRLSPASVPAARAIPGTPFTSNVLSSPMPRPDRAVYLSAVTSAVDAFLHDALSSANGATTDVVDDGINTDTAAAGSITDTDDATPTPTLSVTTTSASSSRSRVA